MKNWNLLNWEKMPVNDDYMIRGFEITGADGVDFIEINGTFVTSYSKEQFIHENVAYPKTNYRFWKILNGTKYYIDYEPR